MARAGAPSADSRLVAQLESVAVECAIPRVIGLRLAVAKRKVRRPGTIKKRGDAVVLVVGRR
jgi:hypothetical protein